MKKKISQIKTYPTAVLILIGIIFIIIAICFRCCGVQEEGEEEIITTSTLKKTIAISELYTAQYTYNGIAEICKDENKTKEECYIKYNAKVRAGIDITKADLKIDDENKTVVITLPEIKVASNPEIDAQTLSYIPSEITVELKEALKACKEDAVSEAQESTELLEVAEKNTKSTIKALLLPLLDSKEYTITWK